MSERGIAKVSSTISIRYDDEENTRHIMAAIEPDNLKAPEGVEVVSRKEGKTLHITVTCERGIGSMISTLDDLFSCIQAAEKAISETRDTR
ncbi:MAG TPA: KEOPS complex subunit Pcc1 [Patescibacteria group bacterium]|nr:KEOPS complex subunit Pcc1 [Patescibacteria group bacterium]